MECGNRALSLFALLRSEPKMTVDSDKLVSWFVQTPPSKNRPFYNWLICFVTIQNDVLYLGGVCTPVYPSLQSSLSELSPKTNNAKKSFQVRKRKNGLFLFKTAKVSMTFDKIDQSFAAFVLLRLVLLSYLTLENESQYEKKKLN